MAKRLSCLIVDAGPANYMKPVFARWLAEPPPFEWSLLLGEKASAVLGDLAGLSDYVVKIVARDGPLGPICADAILSSAGGWPIERAIVHAARDAEVPSAQFLDNCYNYARRFTYDDVRSLPDNVYFVTEESIREALAEDIPVALAIVIGHPSWEQRSLEGPPKCHDVLFIGAPVERDYGRSLGYTERDAWELLVDTLKSMEAWQGRLFYAPHPEQTPDSIPEDADILKFDHRMLAKIETVAGMFSAPLVDAYLAGRKCLSLQPDSTGRDMFFLSRQGFLPRIRDQRQLTAALNAPPTDPGGLGDKLKGSRERLNNHLQEMLAA
ncbi:MAG: hypothetical protein CL569_04845 [Alphaproteobacteria bacterium]|nr:hypothetical protein [Alphaproteobacteria bacterium]|tara:strand:+ start:481 stop:1452 length:972 start_codon:yes stop_codon:yes gene_type:complete